MFRRKKKAETPETIAPEQSAAAEVRSETEIAEAPIRADVSEEAKAVESAPAIASETAGAGEADASAAKSAATKRGRGNRVQKVGTVSSDKMQKTVVVRVDRLVLHQRYRRYVRRTSKFMAHDDLGATIGDRVRIVETRPLSARKRWRVVEIVQKAAK